MSEETTQPEVFEACEVCFKTLDVSAFAPFDKVVCPFCQSETRVKRTLGNYLLESRLAIGGMSVIFTGRDSTLDRLVAIKVLNEEYCHDEIRNSAFEAEARLTAKVSHPNVVRVFGVGRAYGRFYIVMELIEGQSFERIISKKGALPENEVLDLAIQVAHGLQAAKTSGIIHRDVKPANILIDQNNQARLVDFGLALITHEGRAQAEEVWATPYYVPPEALERGIEDFRSDLYAFGATLYHALAGRPPFETTSTSNKVLRRAKETIPHLCQVAPWVTPATGAVIDRMMTFNPEHRWSSYEELLKALQNARQNLSKTPAPPQNPVLDLKSRRTRSKAPALIITTVVAAFIAVVLLWQPWQTNTPPPLNDTPDTSPTSSTLQFNPTGATSPNPRVISEKWQNARELIASQNFAEAHQAFAQIGTDPNVPRTSRGWAMLEATTAALLDGSPGKARELAPKITENLKNSTTHPEVVAALKKASPILAQTSPIKPQDFPPSVDSLADLTVTLALALKQWEQSNWQDAIISLAKVRDAPLDPDFDWFIPYQKIVDRYLADAEILAKINRLPTPTSLDETNPQINQIDEAIGQLRTEGRARYNLRAHRTYLSRLRQQFQSTSPKIQEAAWPNIRAMLVAHGKNLNLTEIAAILNTLPKDTPAEATFAWKFLHQQTAEFLQDLATTTDWTATTMDGESFTIKSCDLNGPKNDDDITIPWKNLNTQKLIAEHVGEPSTAVAYVQLSGDSTLAETLAETLAKNDDEFRQNWRRVMVGLSQ